MVSVSTYDFEDTERLWIIENKASTQQTFRRMTRRLLLSSNCNALKKNKVLLCRRFVNTQSRTQRQLPRASELVFESFPSCPRIQKDDRAISCQDFTKLFQSLSAGQSNLQSIILLRGRIAAIRVAGSNLAFIDIVQGLDSVQIILDAKKIESNDAESDQVPRFLRGLKRGDIISAIGSPLRSTKGSLSLSAQQVPQVLALAFHDLPKEIRDKELIARNWPLENLINATSMERFRLRSDVISFVRSFLQGKQFMEVETPILAGSAGGAMATPFKTQATEFPEWEMALRIAPELWLKRIIISGVDRLYEIGPSFRNEGLDKSHNPEFTICECYQAFANLEDLIGFTEEFFSLLGTFIESQIKKHYIHLPPGKTFSPPFARLSFIPALEKVIGQKLPDLSNPSSMEDLANLITSKGLRVPKASNVAQLLDSLASEHIEPKLQEPTFLIHHPAIMSPLAKSFVDPETGQEVTARAELFIEGREIVNAYEEENSPFDQRQKLVQQKVMIENLPNTQATGEEIKIGESDENYCHTLELGMPPTGGWGCGIDRLVMLLSGAERISQVRAFGSLRNIVGLSRESTR
ncbi:MAG: hypothetical protein M1814_001840 [Vezdaea aestivalis]|nr:MAG: hypothetical protein M1814_001840 [Vezdaea aestivalis]